MIQIPQATAKSGKGLSAPNAPIMAMKLIKMVPKNLIVGHIVLFFDNQYNTLRVYLTHVRFFGVNE